MTYRPRKYEYKDPSRPFPDGLTWYALKTMANREARAADWIEQHRDIGAFTLTPLETIIQNKLKRGGKDRLRPSTVKQVPWIPRIIFAGFTTPPNWLTVLTCNDILGFIGMDYRPVSIGHREMCHLQAISRTLRRDTDKPLLPGSLATLLKLGVFQGHKVRVISVKNDKVIYELNQVGLKTRGVASIADLEAV